MACVFCDIVAGVIPAEIEHQDDVAIVFKDLHPKAPIHLLLVPRQHLVSLADSSVDDQALLGHLLLLTKQIAANHQLAGYRTIINTGRDGGQVIDHLHLHLLGANPNQAGIRFNGKVPEVEV